MNCNDINAAYKINLDSTYEAVFTEFEFITQILKLKLELCNNKNLKTCGDLIPYANSISGVLRLIPCRLNMFSGQMLDDPQQMSFNF